MSWTRKTGVVLITALFLVILIGAVARAVLWLGPASLTLGDQQAYRALASQAAESGLEYALARLREKPSWRGDGPGLDQPRLVVREAQGNVIGRLALVTGEVGEFRIRFNFQDGPAGGRGDADDLDDPEMPIDSIYVSINNLGQVLPRPVPRAHRNTWRVDEKSPRPYEVPGVTACVLVEGRSGPGLRQLEPSGPRQGEIVSVVREAYYQLDLNQPVSDAAIMGGGDLLLYTKGDVKLESSGRVPARIRSKKSIQLRQLKDDQPPAKLDLRGRTLEIGLDLRGEPPGSGPPSSFVGELEKSARVGFVNEYVRDGKDFYNLRWEDIHQARDNPQAARIKAGVYAYWEDGSLHYYALNWEEYRALSDEARGAGTLLPQIPDQNGLKVESFDTKPPTVNWVVTGDLYVEPVAGVQDFVVIPRHGGAAWSQDARYALPGKGLDASGIRLNLADATISAEGDVLIIGSLDSLGGTLTTAGSLTAILRDSRLLTRDEDDRNKGPADQPLPLHLNLYARGDIELSTYRPRQGKDFQDLPLSGLIYTWGDFIARCSAIGNKKGGGFYLEGALVAYGGDPTAKNPGEDGSGRIEIYGNTVDLTWNGGYVARAVSPGYGTTAVRPVLYYRR